ncbi:MAG: hypothetical protein WCT04_18455 [Planctomycetota bacterium]
MNWLKKLKTFPRHSPQRNADASVPPVPHMDSRLLRWLATLSAIETLAAMFLYNQATWLLLPSVAALGVFLSLYFSHLLLFRMQCSLVELFAITTTYGIFTGLVVSTPGAMKIGSYLSPMIAAWVLYSAVSGIANATLFGTTTIRARLLLMAAVLWGNAALPLIGLGALIFAWLFNPRFGMEIYRDYAWPLVIIGVLGLALNAAIFVKTRRIAKAMLAAPTL